MSSGAIAVLRVFLFRLLLFAAVATGALSVPVFQDMAHHEARHAEQEQAELEFLSRLVSREMADLFRDLLDLKHRRSVARFLENPTPDSLAQMEESFLLFAQDNPQYDKLRVLAPDGREILRINSAQGRSRIVPPGELQDKSERYYFREVMALAPGEVYTSPLDLNMEHGQVETPPKPVLRLGVRLNDAGGRLLGVLIINYLGKELLNRLQEEKRQGRTTMLVNRDGYWLHGGKDADFAFMYPDRQGRTFAAAHPAVWREMLVRKSGQVENDDGLYTYDSLALSPQRAPGDSLGNAQVPESLLQRWFIISHTSPRDMVRVRWSEWRLYLGGYLAVLFLCALGAWLQAVQARERRAAQSALARSEARFRGLVETSPDLIWEMDRQGGVVYVSPRVEGILGLGPEEIMARGLEGIMPEGEAERAREKLAHTGDAAVPTTWETRCRHASGREVELEVSSVPMLNAQQQVIGYGGVARDITQGKQVLRLLEEARQEAEAANRAKSEFLARMSHEIRTPLNAVIGMCHLALKTGLTPKQRDYLSKIRISSDALLGVINDILDFSKIEAGKLVIESARFKLDDVLNNVADINTLSAEERNLEFLLAVGEDIPRVMQGDPLRLGQVLINLVHNAVKFTEKGEVLLSVALQELGQGRASIRFSVRDTGIGMSPEQVAGLFQPFTQADGSITRRFGGTGLGLSICSRLVALMGGELAVSSSPGQGSEFFFTLEFPVLEDAPAQPPAELSSLAGTVVLVVDDNATSRSILRDILRSLRFRVAVVSSGVEALRMIERSNRFQAVLLDWRMPGMDGAECARAIRRMPLPRQPALIMVTAYGREEVRRKAENSGVDALLLKPVSRSVLFNTIAEALGRPVNKEDRPRDGRDESAPTRLRGARVLLVEDNVINQQVACELLEGSGIQVTVAGDGESALRILAEKEFQAVLMDIQMPGMGGLEATRRIRSQLGLHLPIIAMTAHAMSTDRQDSLQAGMNDHVNKPVDPRELFAALDRWIPAGGWVPAAAPAAPPPPDPGEENQLPASIYGVDVSMGLARVRGNRVLFRKLLQEFARDYVGAAQATRDSLVAGDLKTARRTAHTLKGVAGNVGAMQLHGIASELDACIGKNPTHCAQLLAQLDTELSLVAASIHEVLGVDGPSAKAGAANPESSPEQLDGVVTTLMDLLGRHDTQALDVFDAAESDLLHYAPQQAKDLARTLRQFDFRAARDHAAALLEILRTGGGR